MKLADVIEELIEERGLDRAVLASIVSEGLLAAYNKKFPYLTLKVEYDKKSGELVVFVEKEVVASVDDEEFEISLKKARFMSKDVEIGDKIWVPFEEGIGRIEILRARQVIASKIRKIEADTIFEQFKDKEGEIVLGVVHKCERNGTVVKLGDALAFLPKSLSIPGEKCVVGFSVRALLKEVLPEPRNDNQLILDRVSSQFLQKLFALEIPEVFEKLVEIKKIARSAGYKSKVIVVSNDKNIDPVGTCVGVGGSRIKPILKELGAEKIDVIPWTESLEDLVKHALKPAVIDHVKIEGNTAQVWLGEDQRSLAIGKMGQNIALASKLVGLDIQLMQQDKSVASEMIGSVEDSDQFD